MSSTELVIERRRAPRVEPAAPQAATAKVPVPVRVVDISRSGVLLTTRVELTPGDRAELRARVGQRSISIPLVIRHVSAERRPHGPVRYRAGAAFANLTTEQRVVLEELLGMEPM